MLVNFCAIRTGGTIFGGTGDGERYYMTPAGLQASVFVDRHGSMTSVVAWECKVGGQWRWVLFNTNAVELPRISFGREEAIDALEMWTRYDDVIRAIGYCDENAGAGLASEIYRIGDGRTATLIYAGGLLVGVVKRDAQAHEIDRRP